MKVVKHSMEAAERAREALEAVENAFGVKTNIKAGSRYNGHAQGGPWANPIVALYGVVYDDSLA